MRAYLWMWKFFRRTDLLFCGLSVTCNILFRVNFRRENNKRKIIAGNRNYILQMFHNLKCNYKLCHLLINKNCYGVFIPYIKFIKINKWELMF